MLFRSLGKVDTYCWGMTFYTMILNKNDNDLADELEFFKLGKEETYNGFRDSMKLYMEKMDCTREQEVKKNFIIDQLYQALNYKSKERPKMSKINENIKNLEKVNQIKINYRQSEKQFIQSITEIMAFNNLAHEENIKSKIDLEEAIVDITKIKFCHYCTDKINLKAKLSCNHAVCGFCLNKFALAKFFNNENYDHKGFCHICKEDKQIRNLS